MPTAIAQYKPSVTSPALCGGVGPHHDEHDGDCPVPTCKVEAEHNHTTEWGCLNCVRDFLEGLFPLEDTIKELKVNSTTKQLLLMASNLTPALLMSEVNKPFHTDSLIASPMSIVAMHLTNRGFKNPLKLFFTCLSSLAVISAQKFNLFQSTNNTNRASPI